MPFFLHQSLDHVFVGSPISPHLFEQLRVFCFNFFQQFIRFNCDNLVEQKPSQFVLCSFVWFFLWKRSPFFQFWFFSKFIDHSPSEFSDVKSFHGATVSRRTNLGWFRCSERKKVRCSFELDFMRQLDGEKRSSQCWPDEEKFSTRHTLETEKQKDKPKKKQTNLFDYLGVSKKKFVKFARIKISLPPIIVEKMEKKWRKLKNVWHRCKS